MSPRRLASPCAAPGCPALTLESRCEQHAHQAKRERNRTYNQQRGSSTRQGYGARWRKLRLLVLHEEPLCRACTADGRVTAATDVDHIVSRRAGGTDERSNLQALCRSHHSQKTNAEDGGGWPSGQQR